MVVHATLRRVWPSRVLAKPRLVRPSCGEGRVRVASDLRAARHILNDRRRIDADVKRIVLLDKQRRFGSRLCCGARSGAGGCRQKRGAGAMKAQGLGRALFAPAF
jgi:hypothetical protein